MPSLLEELESQFDDRAIGQISQQLGVDSKTAASSVQAALPMLMGALSHQGSSAKGASGLLEMLDRDGDGSIMDDVLGYLTKGGASAAAPSRANAGASAGAGGGGLLDVFFGGRSDAVAKTLGASTGMNSGSAMKLLAMLAPVVMGMMAKQKKQQGLDLGGLTKALAGEKNNIEARMPGGSDLLGSLLDSDGDGSITDDLAAKGLGILKGFLGGR